MRFHSRFMEIIVSLIIQLVNCSRQLFVSVCLRLKSSYMPKKIQFAQSQKHKRGTFIHPAVTQNKSLSLLTNPQDRGKKLTGIHSETLERVLASGSSKHTSTIFT